MDSKREILTTLQGQTAGFCEVRQLSSKSQVVD